MTSLHSDRSHPTGITYARARLWLGITGVGLQVVLSLILLLSAIPEQLGMGGEVTLGSEMATVFVLLLIVAVIQLPFDLFGGYLVPAQYGRSLRPVRETLTKILAGVIVHTTLFVAIACLYLLIGSLFGIPGFIASYMTVSLLLVVGQRVSAALVGTFSMHRPTGEGSLADLSSALGHPLIAEVQDTSFVGGVVIDGRRRRAIIPKFWDRSLSPTTRGFALARRAVLMGSPAWVVAPLLSLLFNFLGFALFLLIIQPTAVTSTTVIQLSCWSTIWSFLGLLILPSLNRPAVFALDALAVSQGIQITDAQSAIHELDKLQEEEPSRSEWVERIFHPIPSAERRKQNLTDSSPASSALLVFHQIVRRMLYLSWANLNLLSRSVHCNVGKPECWVLFPGD